MANYSVPQPAAAPSPLDYLTPDKFEVLPTDNNLVRTHISDPMTDPS